MVGAPDETGASAEAALDAGTAGAVRRREGWNFDGDDGDVLDEMVRS